MTTILILLLMAGGYALFTLARPHKGCTSAAGGVRGRSAAARWRARAARGPGSSSGWSAVSSTTARRRQ